MKRSTFNTFGSPLAAWTQLAWTIGEMSLASAQVIAHRTARMAAAGPVPHARDRKEFTRMGTEKIEAATASAQALASHMTTENLTLGARAFGHMLTNTAALFSLAASRNAGQFIARQAKLADSCGRSAKTATDYFNFTVRVAGQGIKPYHARATANARRLK
jgi:hypothetical protein